MNDVVAVPEVEMEFSPSIAKLSKALVAAQGAMGAAIKGTENPFFHKKYANLSEVIAVVKDPLNSNGICFMQPVVGSSEKSVRVATILLHESGEWMKASVSFPAVKVDPQAFGSAVSYARRYSLQSFLSVPAEDDDGNKASGKKADNYGAAMVQDFPPDTALTGILKELIPAQGATAGTAKIQLPDGLMSFDMLDSGDQYKPLLNCRVEIVYGKNGKLRPITEMVLAPTVVQAPLKPIPGPVRTAPAPTVAVLQPEATTEAYESVSGDQAEPPDEAYFETAKDCVGLVINVDPKKSRDGSKTWHVLTIACVNCDIQAKVWGAPSHFGFDSFEELLDKQVWFKVWSKEFRGTMEHTIDMLELYNQSPATK